MISVIIPTNNAADTLGSCLGNLSGRTINGRPVEVIIVDSGSTDNTVEIAKASGVRIVRAEEKFPTRGRNQALRKAKGEIICFTNPDCSPSKEWLGQITAPFSDPNIIGCKGAYVTSQKNVVSRFIQLEYEEKYERLRREEYIDFIDGYSAAFRRDILLVNGGFDERFSRLEDQELSYRLASRGYKMVFVQDAFVRHNHFTGVVPYLRSKFRTAYWKSQVVRKFPDRAYRDSYTPQILKIQMVLVALFLLTLIITPAIQNATIVPFSIGAAFLMTSIPFVYRTWQRDRTVALLSPLFLVGRATALGFGYLLGAIRFTAVTRQQESTISGLDYLAKRAMDVIGSIAGMLVLLTLFPFIGLAIKLTTPGPVLFLQERVGRGGQKFTMYKFRSMVAGADKEFAWLPNDHVSISKRSNDPRITPIGRFLRRWSLDELPQFWNVFIGDMSLIGPRPEESSIVVMYNDHQRRRLTVKPGITGPMQVSGRADLSLDERVSLEIEYIENYSLLKDLLILFRTVPALILGRGAR